jgi:transposase
MTTAHTTQGSTETQVLYMALALGWNDWTVRCTVGLGPAPWQVSVRARDLSGLLTQIAQAKRRFGLAADVPVHCVYEAGRDGFWLHRVLQAHRSQNGVVEASRIEVNRRYRRSKPAKLAVQKRLTMLVRFVLGAWSSRPGDGYPGNPTASGVGGIRRAVDMGAPAYGSWGLAPWRGNSWGPYGGSSRGARARRARSWPTGTGR